MLTLCEGYGESREGMLSFTSVTWCPRIFFSSTANYHSKVKVRSTVIVASTQGGDGGDVDSNVESEHGLPIRAKISLLKPPVFSNYCSS